MSTTTQATQMNNTKKTIVRKGFKIKTPKSTKAVNKTLSVVEEDLIADAIDEVLSENEATEVSSADESADETEVESDNETEDEVEISAECKTLIDIRDKLSSKDKKVASFSDTEIAEVVAIAGINGQGRKTQDRTAHKKVLTQRQLVIAEWIDKQMVIVKNIENKESGEKQATTMRASNMGVSMKIEKAFAEEIQNHYEKKFGYRYSQTAFNHLFNHYVFKMLGMGNAYVRSGYTKYKVFGEKSPKAGQEDYDTITGCDIPATFWDTFMGGFVETPEAKEQLDIGEEPIRLARENRKGAKGQSKKGKAKMKNAQTIIDTIDDDMDEDQLNALILKLQQKKKQKQSSSASECSSESDSN